jgi:hypothetical protein
MRSRLQVLTKDELKEVMKARNMVGSGINRRSKDGKFLRFSLSTSMTSGSSYIQNFCH